MKPLARPGTLSLSPEIPRRSFFELYRNEIFTNPLHYPYRNGKLFNGIFIYLLNAKLNKKCGCIDLFLNGMLAITA